MPPRATRRSATCSPSATRCSAQAMKSVNVLRLWRSLPSSYQRPAHLAAAADVGDGEDEARGRAARGAAMEKHGSIEAS